MHFKAIVVNVSFTMVSRLLIEEILNRFARYSFQAGAGM